MTVCPVCLNPFVFGRPHEDCELSVLRDAALLFAEDVEPVLVGIQHLCEEDGKERREG